MSYRYPSRSLSASFWGLETCDTLERTREANVSVVELPINELCIVLPAVPEDAGWTPILFYDNGVAIRGYIHPEVWTPCLSTPDLPIVTVHHVEERGTKEPSLYFNEGLGPPYPGMHEVAGKYPGEMHYVMNCQWRGAGRYGVTRACSGHCGSVATAFARNPYLMGRILLFAVTPRTTIVYCRRAKHRSVSVANILNMIAGRRIDWRYACRPWCHQCCGDSLVDNPDRLFLSLRELPANTEISRSLLNACDLVWL